MYFDLDIERFLLILLCYLVAALIIPSETLMTGFKLRPGSKNYRLDLMVMFMLSSLKAVIPTKKRGGEKRFGCSRWLRCVKIFMPYEISQNRDQKMSLKGLLLGLRLALSCKLRLSLQIGLHKLV